MEQHIHHFLESLAAFVTVIGLVSPWLYRWTVRINITHKFSSDMANNHLPHLYRGQKLIAKKLGVDLEDEPMIQFVEINGKK